MTGTPKAPPLAPAIRATLGALRRRIRAYVWLYGLAAVVVWLGVMFWGSLLFDWFFEPGQAVRIGMLAFVGVGCAVIAFRLILRRAFVRLTDANMAMLLEHYFPQFNDSLLTVVLLSGRDLPSEQCNPRMLAQTCDLAAEPIGQLRLLRVFNLRPLRLCVVLAALFVVSVAGHRFLFTEAFDIWSRRTLLLSQELWSRRLELAVEGFRDGRVKIARGADIDVVAMADLRGSLEMPSAVRIRYRDHRGARVEKGMSREGAADPDVDPFQQYGFTFHGVLEPIEFDILAKCEGFGRDSVVRGLRIEVVDSPALIEPVLECRFPAYMQRADRELPVTGLMALPLGTQLSLRAAATKPLAQIEIQSDERTQVIEHPLRRTLNQLIERQRALVQQDVHPDNWITSRAEHASMDEDVGRLAGEAYKRLIERFGKPPTRSDSDEGEDTAPDPPAYDPFETPLIKTFQAAAIAIRESDRLSALSKTGEDADGRIHDARRQALTALEEVGELFDPLLAFTRFRYDLLPFVEDRTILLTLVDLDGVRGREPIQLTLATVADRPPELTVLLRGVGSAITPQAQLPAVGQTVDDYGIDQIWFDYTIDQVSSGREPIASPKDTATEVKLDRALDVRPLGLAPGEKLVVSIKASDHYNLGGAEPNVGSSDRWTLDIVTAKQLRAILEAREIVLRQRFQAIIDEMVETGDLLDRMQFDPPSADPNDSPPMGLPPADPDTGAEPGDIARETAPPDSRESIERLLRLRTLRVQRALQNSQKGAHETSGVGRAFADIREELINNRIYTEELRIRIEEHISQPLGRIVDQMFPVLDRRLDELETKVDEPLAGRETRALARQQVSSIVNAMRDVLDRMIELEDFNEAVELLRSIIEAEEKLRQQTERRQKQKLRELLED